MSENPSLYQVNTRVWLGERARTLGRPATLDDVDDAFLDRIASWGFEWVWFLGLWQTGEEGRTVSRTQPDWVAGYPLDLPDVTEADICGSPFAITACSVADDFGGDDALARLRTRLGQRGLSLLVDFVPNHTAIDHPWVNQHPERYVHGTEADLAAAPQSHLRVDTAAGPAVLAHGRDPYFDGWPDTVQLNHRHAGLRAAQQAVLADIATRADAVRCDMAMLLLPDVIARTWGEQALPADGSAPVDDPWWPDAIAAARTAHRPAGTDDSFRFAAEVYWDLEQRLLDEGFDWAYDKRLYDRLRSQDAGAVRGHLQADRAYQRRMLRFLENHDEERAAMVFPLAVHRAAAVITFFSPGLHLFHEGQFEGRRVHVSMHLSRRPDEPADPALVAFYRQLLAALDRDVVRRGAWRLLDCTEAWSGNPTAGQFIVATWQAPELAPLVVAVNYGPTPAQCYVRLPLDGVGNDAVDLHDLMGDAVYRRDPADLRAGGLYLDVAPWTHHVFEVRPATP